MSLDQARLRPHLRVTAARDLARSGMPDWPPGDEDEEGGRGQVGAAGGDRRALRGVPVVGVGLGAVAGSNPVAALLGKERRRGV